MKKLIFVLGITLGLVAVSCNKDEDKQEPAPKEITIDNKQVSVIEKESVTIKITSGNDGYKATSSSEENASVSIEKDVITVTGKKREMPKSL